MELIKFSTFEFAGLSTLLAGVKLGLYLVSCSSVHKFDRTIDKFYQIYA